MGGGGETQEEEQEWRERGETGGLLMVESPVCGSGW